MYKDSTEPTSHSSEEDAVQHSMRLVQPTGFDFSLYVEPRDAGLFSQQEESLTARIFKNAIHRFDVFVDAGAQYGFFSILAGCESRDLRIISMGPDEERTGILSKNLSANGIEGGRLSCITADLSSAKLDDMLEQESYRNLMVRIDARGNEVRVLQGLRRTLQHQGETMLLIRVYPGTDGSQEDSPAKMLELLRSYDLRMFGIDEKGYRFYPIDVPSNLEKLYHECQGGYFNLFCIQREHARSVAFFAHDPILSGASRSLLDLVKGLSARGILCTAIVPSEGDLARSMREAGAATLCRSEWQALNTSWLWATTPNDDFEAAKRKFYDTVRSINDYLIPELKQLSPDIIFSQTIASPGGAICAARLGIPHIVSAREYGELDHRLNFFFGFRESMKALYDSSVKVLCVTEDVRKVVFNKDPDNRTEVVYSGIEIDRERQDRDGPVEDFSYDREKGLKIGVFGTIMPGKGQEDIVSACKVLLKNGINVNCYLVGGIGNVEYYNHLKDLTGSEECAGHFTWQRFINDPYDLMDEMDIMVSCARMEALGRTMIEANLMGKPIVYPDTGGFKEFYIDGEHGLGYIPGDHRMLADKIREITLDPGAAARRAHQARQYVQENLSRKKYTDRIMKALEEVAIQPPGHNSHAALRNLFLSNDLAMDYQKVFQAKVYFSLEANSFSESRTLRSGTSTFGQFSFEFEFNGQGFQYLRLDPLEGFAINLELYKIEAIDLEGKPYTGSVTVVYSNGVQSGNFSWRFFTLDPQLHLAFSSPIRTIRFTGEVSKIPFEELIDHLERSQRAAEDKIAEARKEAVPGGFTGFICRSIIKVGSTVQKIIRPGSQ